MSSYQLQSFELRISTHFGYFHATTIVAPLMHFLVTTAVSDVGFGPANHMGIDYA